MNQLNTETLRDVASYVLSAVRFSLKKRKDYFFQLPYFVLGLQNYKRWRKQVTGTAKPSTFGSARKDRKRKLVIVEVGCGIRVPTVRLNGWFPLPRLIFSLTFWTQKQRVRTPPLNMYPFSVCFFTRDFFVLDWLVQEASI